MMHAIRILAWRCRAIMPLPMLVISVLAPVLTAGALLVQAPRVDVDELQAQKRLLDVEVQTLAAQVRIFLEPPSSGAMPAALGSASEILELAMREQCGLLPDEYRIDLENLDVIRVTVDTSPLSGLCAMDSISLTALSGSVLEAQMNTELFHMVWEGVNHG